MNSNHYDRSAINRLIESAAPNPHELCKRRLEFAEDALVNSMAKADHFEREVRSLEIVVIVLAVMLVAVVVGFLRSR